MFVVSAYVICIIVIYLLLFPFHKIYIYLDLQQIDVNMTRNV